MTDLEKLPKVLFTTDLSGEQKSLLKSDNFSYLSLPFISFKFVEFEKWKSKLPGNYDAWVFTSKRAVEAVKPYIKSLLVPEYVFAVGEKTAHKLEKVSLSPILPKEYNLQSLSKLMNEFKLNTIIHFCGNLKAGNLPELLDDKSVNVTSIEVYLTKMTPQKINESDFDSFVFMSPSAVKSFHLKNKINPGANIFCIGPSTANTLKDLGIHNYIMAEISTFDSLAESIKKFYN